MMPLEIDQISDRPYFNFKSKLRKAEKRFHEAQIQELRRLQILKMFDKALEPPFWSELIDEVM